MNDSYPKDHPGCLSKAREVLRQAMQDTDVQNVTYLEFQEEVTQALVVCAVNQHRVAQCYDAYMQTTRCWSWVFVPVLLSVAIRAALRSSPCSLVCTAAHPGPAAGLHWPPLCRRARGDGGASDQGSSEYHWVVKRGSRWSQAGIYVNSYSLAYGLSRSGLISVYSSIKCFAT
jgi:hypothetical protein